MTRLRLALAAALCVAVVLHPSWPVVAALALVVALEVLAAIEARWLRTSSEAERLAFEHAKIVPLLEKRTAEVIDRVNVLQSVQRAHSIPGFGRGPSPG